MALDYAHAGLQALQRSGSEIQRLKEELETARQVSLQQYLVYPPEQAAFDMTDSDDCRYDTDPDHRNYRPCVLKVLRNSLLPKEEPAIPKL
jgi:hypothetical protein